MVRSHLFSAFLFMGMAVHLHRWQTMNEYEENTYKYSNKKILPNRKNYEMNIV